MSVRKGDRTVSDFDVLTLMRNLTKYTIQAVGNENLFPKKSRWVIAQKIANECTDAYSCIMGANSVWIDKNSPDEEKKYRRSLQVQAHSHLQSLLALVDMAYMCYGLNSEKIEYWTQSVRDTDTKLKAWMKSEKQKFS